jgi:hypothetical protein
VKVLESIDNRPFNVDADDISDSPLLTPREPTIKKTGIPGIQ